MENEKPLKEVISAMLEKYRLSEKVNQYKLMSRWEEVVGKLITRHTVSLSINRKTLFVEIESSIVRNEVFIMKSKIISELNKGFEKEIINNIVFR